MPDFVVTGPDGRSYTVTGPPGSTQDQALEFAKRNYQSAAPPQRRTPYDALSQRQQQPKPLEQSTPPKQEQAEGEESKGFMARGGPVSRFAKGAAFGLIGEPIVGLGQLAEHALGTHLAPESIRSALKDMRRDVESTTAGYAGDWAGSIAGMAAAPEVLGVGGAIARGVAGGARTGVRAAQATREALAAEEAAGGAAARGARVGKVTPKTPPEPRLTMAERLANRDAAKAAAGTSLAARAGYGALGGAAQPVTDPHTDFTTQKAAQVGLGAIVPGVGGSPAALKYGSIMGVLGALTEYFGGLGLGGGIAGYALAKDFIHGGLDALEKKFAGKVGKKSSGALGALAGKSIEIGSPEGQPTGPPALEPQYSDEERRQRGMPLRITIPRSQ